MDNRFLSAISLELRLFKAFTFRDWSATVIPGVIVGLGATKRANLPLLDVAACLPWMFMYIYFFTLSNQLTGIEEDRINKPDRPIPSGKITVRGAIYRWGLALTVFVGLALRNGKQIPETLIWVITTGLVSLTSVGGHWFFKNTVAMTLASRCKTVAVYKAIATPNVDEERVLLCLAIWYGVLMQLQDLRDVAGDAATGRKTLPVVLGDGGSRWAILLGFLPLGCGVLWAGGVLSKSPIVILSVHAFLGYRVMQRKGPLYDHQTYLDFTYLYYVFE
ncbi:hypothetical protein ONZ45_g2485 [Pleurotus djamor]|nr:hypothetical protein ONZ45_g2485 [Pleurotus djamor]